MHVGKSLRAYEQLQPGAWLPSVLLTLVGKTRRSTVLGPLAAQIGDSIAVHVSLRIRTQAAAPHAALRLNTHPEAGSRHCGIAAARDTACPGS